MLETFGRDYPDRAALLRDYIGESLDYLSLGTVWYEERLYLIDDLLLPAFQSWVVIEARGVNNRGQILGQAFNQGKLYTVLLDPQ